MEWVWSKDGTRIAYERIGSGLPLLIVSGALSDRSAAAGLAPLLAESFTVFAFDRRGRGDSGDTPPYSPEREIEDIAAILEVAGRPAYLYGHSSGGALSLDAAQRLGGFGRLAVYEPPFVVVPEGQGPPRDYMERIARLLATGNRTEAVEYFLRVGAGIPQARLERIKPSRAWERMEGMAHTLAHERDIMGETLSGRPLPRDRWPGVVLPTLVMSGGASPPWFASAADALAEILPAARRKTLERQNHVVEPAAIARELIRFFGGVDASPTRGDDQVRSRR